MPLNWRNILIAIAFAIILVPSYTLVGISIYKKLSSGICKDTKNFSNDTDSPENEEKDKGGDDKGDQEENDEEESRKPVPEPVKSTTTVMLTTTVKPTTTTEALIIDSDNPGGKCYRDRNSRDLPKKFIIPNGQISSIYWCTSKCRKEDYKYAGVQNYHDCWCGNEYGRHGEKLKSDCDYSCEDHHTKTLSHTETCGGWYRNNIYKSELPEGRCYNDDLNDKDLKPVSYIPQSQTSSIKWCKNECRNKLYYFAGVRNGNICSCGNKFSKHNLSRKQSDCNKRCFDYENNICGGQLRINIYLSNLEVELDGGCYNYHGLHDANEIGTIYSNNLPISAITYCKEKCISSAYVGITSGDRCYCGTSFDYNYKVDKYECSSYCQDSTGKLYECGGPSYFFNIYKVDL